LNCIDHVNCYSKLLRNVNEMCLAIFRLPWQMFPGFSSVVRRMPGHSKRLPLTFPPPVTEVLSHGDPMKGRNVRGNQPTPN
jgi:hypothetical protein